MSPFHPESARQQRRQRCMGSMGGGPCAPLGSFSTVGAWPRAHPGSPVTAGHTPNPLWAPVLGESPPVPREEAELGGCHQVGLPGPGLDRGFLCGGNRDVCHAENTPQAEPSGEGQEVAKSQVPGLRVLGRAGTAPGEGKLQTDARRANKRSRDAVQALRKGQQAGPALPTPKEGDRGSKEHCGSGKKRGIVTEESGPGGAFLKAS